MFCPFSGVFRDFGGLVLQEAEISNFIPDIKKKKQQH